MNSPLPGGLSSQMQKLISRTTLFKRGNLRWFFIAFVVCLLLRLSYIPLTVSIMPDRDFQWSFDATRDLAVYIQPENVTAVIENPDFCHVPEERIFLLIIVCSASRNFEARSTIRETWGSYQNSSSSHSNSRVRVAFLLGESSNSTTQDEILEESEKYGDIVQEGFQDSYLNLTLKSVMMLKWTSTHCPKAQFLFKTDDDMFVNVPELIKYLQQPLVASRQNLIAGSLFCWAKPIKDHHSKWYSPEFMFQGKEYPNYVSGTGYVISGALVPRLFNASLEVPFFHLEDIFVTGMVASKIGIVPENYHLFTYFKHKPSEPCMYRHIITSHGLEPGEISTVWTSLHNPALNCTAFKVPKIGEPKLKTCVRPKQRTRPKKYG